MLKSFLLAFAIPVPAGDPAAVSPKSMLDFLDKQPEIANWMHILPGAVILISQGSATDLMQVINRRFPDAHFIVAELVGSRKDGLLGGPVWDFINNPAANTSER